MALARPAGPMVASGRMSYPRQEDCRCAEGVCEPYPVEAGSGYEWDGPLVRGLCLAPDGLDVEGDIDPAMDEHS